MYYFDAIFMLSSKTNTKHRNKCHNSYVTVTVTLNKFIEKNINLSSEMSRSLFVIVNVTVNQIIIA